MSVNTEAAKTYLPAEIHLLSGKVISTNIAIPAKASQKSLSYKNDISGEEQKIESSSIEYVTLQNGNSEIEFKYGTLTISLGKKRAINYKKKKWYVRINKAGGNKAGMYILGSQYSLTNNGDINVYAREVVYCISKRGASKCIGVYQGGGFNTTIGKTPTFSFISTKRFKVNVAKKYFADQPNLAEQLENKKMNWEEFCNTYQTLSE
jgi:hypothetical protein